MISFSESDVVIHLAGLNRHNDDEEIFQTNIKLAKDISNSITRTSFSGKLIYISSIHELNNSRYGASKLKAREILTKGCKEVGCKFTALIVPNVYGPFSKPKYNSFISTFSETLVSSESIPKIIENRSIQLIYIDNLIAKILDELNTNTNVNKFVEYDIEIKVQDVLNKLIYFKKLYVDNSEIPDIKDSFDLSLFNTFRSFINHNQFYPKKFKNNKDDRGDFIEILKSESKGQYSYSITKPGKIRGNHFHTRKVERFAVIKGEALIKIRMIGKKETFEFKLSGDNPSFIDMPIWYTHSIENISDTELLTLFWINEPYNPEDPDTFFENV